MKNLNEGKKKAPSYMAELSEIDKQSSITTMEAKINKLAEMADKKKERLNMVSEDENLSELIDKKRVKMMEREIKEIEKAKMKLEKLYEKACGSKPKEMVDEDARTDAEEEGYLDGMKDEKEDMEEGYSTPSYEEDDTDPMNEEYNKYNKFKTMETPVNEEFRRMQKLAGIITESPLNEAKEIDMAKSYLENKGLKVENVDSGNDGEAKASKFSGVSNPEADKTAYIWNGGEGDQNYKSNGKEAFYVYIPYKKEIAEEMKKKFPVLDIGGKSGTYYTLTIEKK